MPSNGERIYDNGDTLDDRLWWATMTHGRGLDTLPEEIKREANRRFAHRGTGPMFPEAERHEGETMLTLAENLSVAEAKVASIKAAMEPR